MNYSSIYFSASSSSSISFSFASQWMEIALFHILMTTTTTWLWLTIEKETQASGWEEKRREMCEKCDEVLPPSNSLEQHFILIVNYRTRRGSVWWLRHRALSERTSRSSKFSFYVARWVHRGSSSSSSTWLIRMAFHSSDITDALLFPNLFFCLH